MDASHHYGVVVGIDFYPGLGNLKFARKDARHVAAWLQEAGVTGDRLKVVCLPDDATPPASLKEAEPISKRIFDATWEAIDQVRATVKKDPAAWRQTRLYFFFSGHGVAPSAMDATGLAADATPDQYGWSASFKEMAGWLQESGDFAEIVMIADCCRNKPGRATQSWPPPWNPVYRKTSKQVRVATMYATVYGDPAREPRKDRDPDKERGYYTSALLEGLAGHPDAVRADGTVTTASLHEYARRRVIELTGGKQEPPEDAGADLVLADDVPVVQPRARRVRIRFPDDFTGAATLMNGVFQSIGEHAVDGADDEWATDLPPGLYQVTAPGRAFLRDGTFAVKDGEGEFVVQL